MIRWLLCYVLWSTTLNTPDAASQKVLLTTRANTVQNLALQQQKGINNGRVDTSNKQNESSQQQCRRHLCSIMLILAPFLSEGSFQTARGMLHTTHALSAINSLGWKHQNAGVIPTVTKQKSSCIIRKPIDSNNRRGWRNRIIDGF